MVADVWRLMRDGHDDAQLDDIAKELVIILHAEYDLEDIRYEFAGDETVLNAINSRRLKNSAVDSWDDEDDDGDDLFEITDFDDDGEW
jgi:hypothetical protein